jgi:hypothetical protein
MCLWVLQPAALSAGDGRKPLPSSREFGTRLVAQFDVPDEALDRFRKHVATAASKKLSPLENTLLATTADWISEPVSIDSTKNPYTVVVTLTGTAQAAGDITTMWLAGWSQEGTARQTPMTGLMRNDAKAGERVTLTSSGGVTSFTADQKLSAAIGLIKSANVNIEAVHVQVWSGVPKASAREIIQGYYPLWLGGAMFLGWWFFLRKR